MTLRLPPAARAFRAALIGVAAAGALQLAATVAPAADVEVSLSTHYSRGDYGGTGSIDIVYVPLAARVEAGPWAFGAVVPFLGVSGGKTAVEIPGGIVLAENGSREGLGDLLFEGTWLYAPWEHAWLPFVEVGGRLKAPTAGSGLGTGEVDVLPEVQLSREYGRWTPWASVGFRVLGDDSTTYHDGFFAGGGAMVRVAGVQPGVFVFWRQAATDGSDDPLELLPVLRVDATEHWSVDAYASVGFGNAAPDAGGGVQVVWRIPGAW